MMLLVRHQQSTRFFLIKKRGRFVQVGLFAKKYIELDTESIIQREIEYVGCRSQNPFDWPIAIHLLDKGAIQIDKMITKKFPLKSGDKPLKRLWGAREFKVMIESNPGEFKPESQPGKLRKNSLCRSDMGNLFAFFCRN